jgi:hypothetical protein
MGQIRKHPMVKAILAFTFNPHVKTDSVFQELEKVFSTIERKSHTFNFSQFTDYYESEMGRELQKLFLVFARLVKAETLPDIKIATNKIEGLFLEQNKRSVNLDPGYISDSKLVLATTKNYSHRLYLQNGIFGDVHLIYHHNSFHEQPWTYPDYKQIDVIEFFNRVRQRYLHQLGESFTSIPESLE